MKDKRKKKRKGEPAGEGPILVAVDFSDDSGAALSWACRLAAGLKASLQILHVVHDPADSPGYYHKDEKDLLRPMEDVASRMMGEYLRKLTDADPGLKSLNDAKTRLVKGLPVSRIIEVANKIGARMIVMGSRGRTGLDHLLVGSKAEQVVHLSPIPVTIVKAGKATQGKAKKK